MLPGFHQGGRRPTISEANFIGLKRCDFAVSAGGPEFFPPV